MGFVKLFSEDYFEARNKFLKCAESQNYEIQSYPHPNPSLFVDVAYIGGKNVKKIFMTISGVHGAEGFLGSAAQIYILKAELERREDVGLLFVHALNPYGFAHIQRETEDNIDLNRNFLKHEDKKYPKNEGYSLIADFLVPKDWECESNKKGDEFLAEFARRDIIAFNRAVYGGQYTHPKGLFFGGNHYSWSNLTFQQILKDFKLQDAKVVLIDFHTGLGEIGKIEIFSSTTGAPHSMVNNLYGDLIPTIPFPYLMQGDLVDSSRKKIGEKQFVGCVIEYGTVKQGTSALNFLRRDSSYRLGNKEEHVQEEIKTELKEALCPSDIHFRKSACEAALKIAKRGLQFLSS